MGVAAVAAVPAVAVVATLVAVAAVVLVAAAAVVLAFSWTQSEVVLFCVIQRCVVDVGVQRHSDGCVVLRACYHGCAYAFKSLLPARGDG